MQLIPVGDAEKPRNQFPPVYVGDTLIDADAIAREMQHHPAEEVAEVWHEAAKSLVIRELLLQQANRLKLDDIDLFLFHQANLRINEYVAQKLEIPEAKLMNNIQRLGNCSAAALPISARQASIVARRRGRPCSNATPLKPARPIRFGTS